MKKVELLSPAGNFDALKGAIKAGADAVYLGGAQFSARAYADNFTQEEICQGIRLAHLFGRKVYLAVNTLVKEKELAQVYDFLHPFYEEGLDGVIVQDLGVMAFIRSHFPSLALHASTQMAITGSRGAALVKEAGISRIVPARELSLDEMKRIKDQAGVEIEAFIHGAMCYSYSGQCLFSSILGGRSGNRGRCAQPCRLPYQALGSGECYPLSMRDMCTIDLLPELIGAGIDSLKIEGRMKKAAYAAGVTAIYRKYIDLYYQHRENYQVAAKDKELLKSLYIRSEIGDGYYSRARGRETLCLSSPAYSPTKEQLLTEIEKKYIDGRLCQKVKAYVSLKINSPAKLTLQKGSLSVCCKGDLVQKAQKQPLSKESIKERVGKSGNSLLHIEAVGVEADEGVFLPVRSLNELRRKAVLAMEEELAASQGLAHRDRKPSLPPEREVVPEKRDTLLPQKPQMSHDPWKRLHISVSSQDQLKSALASQTGRIYLDYGLLGRETLHLLEEYRNHFPHPAELYLAAPYIVREKDIPFLEKIKQALAGELFQGVLVRNLESCQFFSGMKTVLDANLYVWNKEAAGFWQGRAQECYLPVELNARQWKELLSGGGLGEMKASFLAYGRMPLMVTANCLKKTLGTCNKKPETVTLTDRYQKSFPVYTDCFCCYNLIYNSVPLSLHKLFASPPYPEGNYRLDFTGEDGKETSRIIGYFCEILEKYREPFYQEYTTGHYKRGVE